MKSRGEPGWLAAEEERKAGLNNSFAPSVSNVFGQNYTYGAKKPSSGRAGALGEARAVKRSAAEERQIGQTAGQVGGKTRTRDSRKLTSRAW